MGQQHTARSISLAFLDRENMPELIEPNNWTLTANSLNLNPVDYIVLDSAAAACVYWQIFVMWNASKKF